MGGGLIQLVAYGSQDMYLTGNPQITFFKVVYRRHTNFAIESIKTIFNGSSNFGEEVNATIARSGDLIYRMYLQCKLPSINLSTGLVKSTSATTGTMRAFRWLNWIGHAIIDHIELSIGGQRIDTHTGEWLHIWNELSQNSEHGPAYAEMVGNVPRLTQIQSSNDPAIDVNTEPYTLYIPLQFWFCRHPGLALPIISLQYSDVNIKVKFKELRDCIWASYQDKSENKQYANKTGVDALNSGVTPSLTETYLYVDYIFLDTAERRRFAQVQHEYLIEQVQKKTDTTISSGLSGSVSTSFNFNHPVKEIIWVIQPKTYKQHSYSQSRGGNQNFNFTDAWDYSGFTGTPENFYGPGMAGGRGCQNIFYGLPTVKLEGALNSNNLWTTDNSASTVGSTAGYNDINDYTVNGSLNKYEDRTMEHLLGPSLETPNSGNSTGLWTSTTNNMNIVDSGHNPASSANIQLNGNDRFGKRDGFYFNVIQPYQHHTGSPAPGINVYSFALKPEDYQPSGTCNFSRIDTSQLIIDITEKTTLGRAATLNIYAVNYNILRIMSGMGGLAYSN
jgi:hypothetical protein